MLGLLGLMGALIAGFIVDAMMLPGHHTADDEGGQDDTDLTEARTSDVATGSLLDDTGAANDPAAGMPVSGDGADLPDDDVTMDGGAAKDLLTGDGGNDRISGAAGNDLLGGRGGDDVMGGGDGVDWMHGGDGADRLNGASGSDDLHGETGDDSLDGGVGNDTLTGNGGRDHLVAGDGDDMLWGGEGADMLRGGTGNDALQGGLGHDRANGGTGADTVDGNDGNDTLWGDRAGHDDSATDFLNGGAGNDVLNMGAGDYANGGDGFDQFVLDDIANGDPVSQITDFDLQQDHLVLLYDAMHHFHPEVTVVSHDGSPDATVLLDGIPVAQVLGGAGLQSGHVTLQAA